MYVVHALACRPGYIYSSLLTQPGTLKREQHTKKSGVKRTQRVHGEPLLFYGPISPLMAPPYGRAIHAVGSANHSFKQFIQRVLYAIPDNELVSPGKLVQTRRISPYKVVHALDYG